MAGAVDMDAAAADNDVDAGFELSMVLEARVGLQQTWLPWVKVASAGQQKEAGLAGPSSDGVQEAVQEEDDFQC
jgi:hypothetical protein